MLLTDNTAHNLRVIEFCTEMEADSVSDSLVCHVNPMTMFQMEIKPVWQEIHYAFRANKENIKADQEEAYSNKEKSCLKDESTKYDLLEKSKKEKMLGPFNNEDEVKRYILLKVDDDMKNKCRYDEVIRKDLMFVTEA